MEQIADFIKQLYEYYYLKKNEIKKLQKNISPELLASFGRQLTKTEDTKVELHKAVLNLAKKEQKQAFAMTCTLLTNSEGKKMGKTAKGALWLDAAKTSPYEFYQYWRNVADADVEKCLALLTFLPMDEVRRLGALEGAEINQAKKILAYEVTKLIHGEEEALKAQQGAEGAFGGGDMSNVPSIDFPSDKLGTELLDLLVEHKLIKSKGEGRKFVTQNGLTAADNKVTDFAMKITEDLFKDGEFVVKIGKKKIYRVVLK